MVATDTTVVMVAGLDTPVEAHDLARPPVRAAKDAKGWIDHLPTFALLVNGTEIDASLMPQVRYLYGDEYRITTVPNPDSGKVRVLFTPNDDEDEFAIEEKVVGVGRYKGAISRKV